MIKVKFNVYSILKHMQLEKFKVVREKAILFVNHLLNGSFNLDVILVERI